MKTILSGTLMLLILTNCASSQFIKNAEKLLKDATVESGYSEADAVAGIKEALSVGIQKGVDLVSVENGYFNNLTIKIPFPEDARVVDQKLRSIGLGNEVDKVILSLNRAAEDAAIGAKDIFLTAIKAMTVADAINIVKGADNAATVYLEKTTYDSLFARFKPVVQKSLEKVNATKYWNEAIGSYNKIPFVKKVNPDLENYATQKAIEGLFVMVANEELKIRKDPMARTTAILKKVFGQ